LAKIEIKYSFESDTAKIQEEWNKFKKQLDKDLDKFELIKNPAYWLNIAVFYLRYNLLEEFEESLLKALKEDPKSFAVQYLQAILSVKYKLNITEKKATVLQYLEKSFKYLSIENEEWKVILSILMQK